MPKDPRFEIEDDTMKDLLRDIAARLDFALKEATAGRDKQWGFGLFLFEFDGDAMFWISSGERPDMMKTLREFLQHEQPQ